MIKVIINADDLGLNHVVNEKISDGLIKRHITSATILANTTTWEEVHKIVDSNPDASFGIHLNLTEGMAITMSDAFVRAGIVDENNIFTKKIRQLKVLTPDVIAAVYREWDAQLHKIINVENIRISHIDGHHHIHKEFVFAKILTELVQKYNIKKIRNRYSILNDGLKKLVHIYLGSLSNTNVIFDYIRKNRGSYPYNSFYTIMEDERWRTYMRKNVKMPTLFNAYETMVNYLKRGGKIPKDSIVELMCHPGHPHYMLEYKLIESHVLENYNKDVILISYKDF